MLESKIKVKVKANDYKEAIKEAGQLLVNAGSCTLEYVKQMIQAVEDFGPYMVLTPHVALAHFRPSEVVLENDISLVILDKPVNFNHQANDPVHIVFAFCAKSSKGHLEQLTKLTTYLSDLNIVEKLKGVFTVKEVIHILNNIK